VINLEPPGIAEDSFQMQQFAKYDHLREHIDQKLTDGLQNVILNNRAQQENAEAQTEAMANALVKKKLEAKAKAENEKAEREAQEAKEKDEKERKKREKKEKKEREEKQFADQLKNLRETMKDDYNQKL